MKRVERIAYYEDLFDRSEAAVSKMAEALSDFTAAQKDIKKLERYYTGGQWRADFEADEAGKLPPDLKRGVLSEDGVFDLLSANDALKDLLKKYK